MKHTYLLSILALTLFFGEAKAQSNSWQPLAFISGTSSLKGIDGFTQLTTCNGVQTVLVKFVNNNNYTVKACWKNMIVTKDEQHLSANFLQDSVTIPHNGQVAGDCANNTLQLAYKLSDFGADMNSFNYLIPIDFNFVITH